MKSQNNLVIFAAQTADLLSRSKIMHIITYFKPQNKFKIEMDTNKTTFILCRVHFLNVISFHFDIEKYVPKANVIFAVQTNFRKKKNLKKSWQDCMHTVHF